jgi:dihydroorotate dehydrogenase electron transfer subunit
MYDEIVAVTENRRLTGGHFLLKVHSPRQAAATRPGQFAMIRILGRGDVLLRRPMSIYDVTPGNSRGRKRGPTNRAPEVMEFLYKVVGRGTQLMADLKPGDHVGLLAPLGHGFFAEEYLTQAQDADEVLHVAGGIGIAALLLPAKELAQHGLRQRLFFGGRTKADLVGVEEFRPHVRGMALATEDGSRGHRGFVTRPLEEYLARHQRKKSLLMVCGPWAMLEASVALARRYGHPCLVSMENRMGCGLGVCLGCSIRVVGTRHGSYQRVCTEGPVFWAEKVVWEKESIPKT